MSSGQFYSRGRWEPYPRQARPLSPRAHGHRDAWRDPPWEHQHRRDRGRMHLPSPRQPRPFGGPADIHRNKENGRWAPQDCDVPPPRLYREDHRSRESREDSLRTSSAQGSRLEQHFGKMSSGQFYSRGPRAFLWEPYPRQARPLPPRAHGHRDAWRDSPWEHQHQRARGRMHLPSPRQPRPFGGPADIHQNEENGRWAPQNRDVPPPLWMYREDHRSREIPQLRHRDFFVQPEFPSREQRPAGFLREQEVFQDNYSPQRHCGPRQRRHRLLRPIKQEPSYHSRSPQSSQGYHPSSISSQSCSPESQTGVKKHLDALQSPTARKNCPQSEGQVDEGLLVASSEALERPRPAEKSPEKSLGTDPQAAEQEPAGGSETVKPEGEEEAAGNQQPFALELEPISPEVTSSEEDEGSELIPLEANGESSTQTSKASSDDCAEAAELIMLNTIEEIKIASSFTAQNYISPR
ncbi:uncharacterized protein LOC101749017 isoform X5 [Gallus gallus]|uniref:uncharacterized protein LOC101749017 isoform X5 n=1 Tax=Gallus gallus TaxID=9031 RepID=UPI001AE8DF0A|nr:uncharacterized protein LOC101749017 isoform X5 [Gallus gallus]